eukprot:3674190-Prymnesium_polylepis.1
MATSDCSPHSKLTRWPDGDVDGDVDESPRAIWVQVASSELGLLRMSRRGIGTSSELGLLRMLSGTALGHI